MSTAMGSKRVLSPLSSVAVFILQDQQAFHHFMFRLYAKLQAELSSPAVRHKATLQLTHSPCHLHGFAEAHG